MISKEARELADRTTEFNSRLILQLQAMNAAMKLTYTVDTSAGRVCISTAVETVPSARQIVKGETRDE
jgi:argininosuccinate synthase